VARHPVWGSLCFGGAVFLGMLLLPSLPEPRLLATPLWVGLTLAGGLLSGPVWVLFLRVDTRPLPAGQTKRPSPSWTPCGELKHSGHPLIPQTPQT
jgi:hypothetical protein